MLTGICIIAHAPLASALKTCAQHIYSMTGDRSAERILAYDVPAGVDVEEGLRHARSLVDELLARTAGVVIFTDLTGATPGNNVVSGTNLPAIVAALNTPADAPASQVALLAEAAARASLSPLTSNHD